MKGLLSSIIVFALLIPVVAIANAASITPPAAANEYSAERAALMSLYESTWGVYWYDSEGWGSESSYCEWYGVTCDPSGHVLYLDLAGNMLLGPIPAEIDSLAALQRLNLSGNLIEDPLPEELGNLAQLQFLDLSGNEYCLKGCGRSLGGAIPASLGRLANLQILDLSRNELEGAIPAELGNLAQLRTLDLSGNLFCKSDYFTAEITCYGGLYGVLPAELSNLSALQEFNLLGNKSLCWETTAARQWALTLPVYSGPTDCSYLPFLPRLYFKESTGSGSLTFVKSAVPRDGTDFTFDLSGPANPTAPTFLNKWGREGSGDGEFQYPDGIALDAAGNIYIADYGNNRIQKFDNNGRFITTWGGEGSAEGQFVSPSAVALDREGNVYVADAGNDRIQKFDNNGRFITSWGSYGSAEGEFNYPAGVAVDAAGNVYVADAGNNRIQKFDRDGTFISQWGSYGSGDGQFDFPLDAAVNAAGNVYVVDGGNYRVQKFDKNGAFISQWGGQGSGNGQFEYPSAVAIDAAGNVYVAEQEEIWGGNHRIQKFEKDGNFISKWGSEGSGDGEFSYPSAVAVDRAGNVYVADSGNDRIQRFLATSFVLDDAGADDGDAVGVTVLFDKLPTGLYKVTEQAAGGWKLADLSCIGDKSSQITVDLAHRAVTIDLAAGEHITCLFANRLP
jgi:sugar lactone lactonase YvrE